MILDSIIGLFVSLAAFLTEGVWAITVPVINLALAGIEGFIGLFVSGFALGRVEKRGGDGNSRPAAGALVTLLVVGLVLIATLAPMITQRKITLIAEDGGSLPFAAVMIHTKGGAVSRRTDSAGNVVIPRFGTTAISVSDARYVRKTWSHTEIESQLVVRRTVLGSGLDRLAGQLLAPADK